MAEPRCDLRALVLNYRGADMTLQVVQDLLQMDDVRISIVVIDNGSGAAEQARLREEVAALSSGEHEVELVASEENLGFAAEGEGWKLTMDGATSLDDNGDIPWNCSGGVLSSNPIGASGMIRFAEAARQVRGDAGEHQVDGAKLAAIT